MGVLCAGWTGESQVEFGVRVPVMREYQMADVADPEGWWEVPRKSALGRKLLASYPFCTAVVDQSGALCDVTLCRDPDLKPAEPFVQKSRQRRRRKGVLEGLLQGTTD